MIQLLRIYAPEMYFFLDHMLFRIYIFCPYPAPGKTFFPETFKIALFINIGLPNIASHISYHPAVSSFIVHHVSNECTYTKVTF